MCILCSGCRGKNFWWRCCKEKTVGVSTWRTANCEWAFFTAFLVVLVWVLVCACVFCVSLAFRCKYIYACWVTLKVLLKSILDIKLYSFFFSSHSWFLRKMNTEYRSKFLSPAQYFYKDGVWSRIKSKAHNQVSIFRKSEAWVCFVVWFLDAKLWIVLFIRYSFEVVVLMTQAARGEYAKTIRFWQVSIIHRKKKRDYETKKIY